MHLSCSGCSRRDFLSRAGNGFGALALSALMRMDARAAVPAVSIDPVNPFLPRKPHFAPKAKSVIFLHMVGGPSQVDTFDYKPVLQKLDGQPVPDSIRQAILKTRHSNVFVDCKNLMASPYKFSQHGKSGLWVSELYPNLANHVDDLCFINSMQADSNNHAPASYQMHTGETVPGKASLGAWITYGLGTENQNLPGYVVLFEGGPYGGAANDSNGFLPAAFQGTRLRDKGAPVLDLLPPSKFADGQRASLDLVHELNMKHRAARPGMTELDARIASYELAYRMQSAALEVGDMEKESPQTQASYGLNHQDAQVVKFGRKCLLARRLVERGVRFVQIYNTYDKEGWDAHAHLDQNHPPLARQTDQPIAALLADLKQRNLLDETLVIWAGEFGRTPMMQGEQGRQHNAAGFTVWMAGGGVKAGTQIGMTDEIGLMAVDKPHGFKDLHATILAALGIRCDDLFFEHEGRLERLTGIAGNGEVIPGVLG
ncbi:MAG: DUF1501 domain-containing protein [Verrucomicrobiaceae bacterium]